MRGSLLNAWQYTWIDIWSKLEEKPETPSDLFMQLYPELAKALKNFPEPNEFDTTSNDPVLARTAFSKPLEFRSDRALMHFFEEAGFVIEETGVCGIAGGIRGITQRLLRSLQRSFSTGDALSLAIASARDVCWYIRPNCTEL